MEHSQKKLKPPTKRSKRKETTGNEQWSFTIFAIVLSSVLLLYPIFYSIYLSLQSMQGLNSTFWARVMIIVALCWRWTGYNMFFYLAGLQNISQDTLEAAQMDGATPTQTLFKVVIPQLKPVILFTSITSTIGTLQLFDEVVNLTGGGPSNATLTAAQLIYNHSFVYTSNFGYSN